MSERWPPPPPGPPARHYPAERPDFEPPPPWVEANGSSGSGGPGPYQSGGSSQGPHGYGPLPFDSGRQDQPRGGWSPGKGTLLTLGLVLVLVASALGAAAGLYLGTQYGSPVTLEPPGRPNDELGGRATKFEKPQNAARVASALLPSVVHIKTRSSAGQTTGSGFVIDKEGHLVTNNHVVEPAAESGEITVAFEQGEEMRAEVVGRSPSYDLAVIRVEKGEYLKPVSLGNSDSLVTGEPIVAVGAPLGLHGTVTTGIVSAQDRPVSAGGDDGGEASFLNAIQTDAAINPGNSGGPLVNMKAEVVGVNSAIATLGGEGGPFGESQQQGNIGVGFSIPINQVRRTVTQLIEDGQAVYPVINIGIDTQYQGPGVRVGSVQPGGSADRAGLKTGDIITELNGTKLDGGDDLVVKIRSYLPGQRVVLSYQRGDSEEDVKVALGEQVDTGR